MVLNYSDSQVVLEPDSYFSYAEPVVVTDPGRPGASSDPGEPSSAGPTLSNRPCGSASESRPFEGCQGKVLSETWPVGILPVVGSASESSPVEPRSGVDVGWSSVLSLRPAGTPQVPAPVCDRYLLCLLQSLAGIVRPVPSPVLTGTQQRVWIVPNLTGIERVTDRYSPGARPVLHYRRYQ